MSDLRRREFITLLGGAPLRCGRSQRSPRVLSIALRVMVSASPSSRASTASVVLLRVPLSFPAGCRVDPSRPLDSRMGSLVAHSAFHLSSRTIPSRTEVTECFKTAVE
jgi:hypothetical protein